MKKVFISYGNIAFKKSLKRIAKQARASHKFDKIKIYTPSDLPPPIRYSPLMIFHRGGGYWVWKPWIVYYTLSQCQEGDIVYYVDAGCTLNPDSDEWAEWDAIMTTHDAIVFKYRSDIYYKGWEIYCSKKENCAPELKHWFKPTAEEFFTRFLGSDDYLDFNHVMSGIIIVRKTTMIPLFIQQWLNIAVLNPSLFCDAYGEELGRLPESFNEHRHDQAVLTPLVYHYKDIDKIAILPEKSDSQKEIAAVIATRIHDQSWSLGDRLIWRIKGLYVTATQFFYWLKILISR
jgi:hypothetical protein